MAVEAMKRFEEYNRRSPEMKKVTGTFSKCPCKTTVDYMVTDMYTVYLTGTVGAYKLRRHITIM